MTQKPKDDDIIYWTLKEQIQEKLKIRQQTTQEIFMDIDNVLHYCSPNFYLNILTYREIKQKYLGDSKSKK